MIGQVLKVPEKVRTHFWSYRPKYFIPFVQKHFGSKMICENYEQFFRRSLTQASVR